ncbi:VWA domain-containing protein [Methanosarcina sp.]|uniref:VWA domain-containing protein n=1 Tax=Methanosarcina sp. TaxID=2213 RepID=UPI0029889320|nr:VWA domain-containing protein [Methanosarcina sp.]MDW5549257.1 VWA domain-containing protein [Methanosarcina sp.]MDW5553039.1 VWA domain-containing protein [Methanosarcina sp.]MDW5559436.1 VWA domain-containing protein [Methanosarcina sp.]
MPFENPLALAALLSVIPLIIIYMLRPRPTVLAIPSLMFVLKLERERKRVYASLTKIVRDPLFLIQLLMLVLLSIGAAGYYYTSQEPLSGEHTVLVLDTSASMQVDSRFDDAVKIADGYVSKKNSIILASDTPLLALDGGDASSAKNILNKVNPGAGTADLSAAITTGMRSLSTEGGRIIVISDFTNYKGDDPVASKNLAESYGISVNFVKVGSPANNIGIINGWIEATDGKYGYTGVIKNYKDHSESVKIETGRGTSGNSSTSFSLDVPAGGTKQFTLENLGPGITTVQLDVKDSLPVDNKAYISIPETSNQRILYVTDNGKLPSKTALSLLPNSNLTVSKSVPDMLDNYTLVVLAQKKTPIGNSSVERIESYVRNGGNAVFIVSGALVPEKTDVDLLKILPVKPLKLDNDENGLGVKEVLKSSITTDIRSDEISVRKYLNATERTGSTTLVALDNGVPLLSYWQVGKGTVFYMGLSDELGEDSWNNFHNLPEYPVFWIKLVQWLGGTGDISEYNLNTGTLNSLSKTEEIRTPSKTFTSNRILFDEAGIYELSGKKIAVNLYNDRESNTTVDASELIKRAVAEDGPKIVKEDSYTAKNDITDYLIGFMFLFILLEILIVRQRGEL